MSSDHAIVVARDTETGNVELAMPITLYDLSTAETLLERLKPLYTDNWVLSVYLSTTSFFQPGTKPKPEPQEPAVGIHE